MSCFVRLLVLALGVEWEETTTIFHKIKLIKHFKMALKMLWFVGIWNEFEFSSFYALMRTKMKDEFFSWKELINMLRTVGKLSIWRGFTIRSRTFPTLGSSSGSFQLESWHVSHKKKRPKIFSHWRQTPKKRARASHAPHPSHYRTLFHGSVLRTLLLPQHSIRY